MHARLSSVVGADHSQLDFAVLERRRLEEKGRACATGGGVADLTFTHLLPRRAVYSNFPGGGFEDLQVGGFCI